MKQVESLRWGSVGWGREGRGLDVLFSGGGSAEGGCGGEDGGCEAEQKQ